ncbi:MAG: efflux RND transporter periplasmic adaptor subunit [Pseudomonadota bacterium]
MFRTTSLQRFRFRTVNSALSAAVGLCLLAGCSDPDIDATTAADRRERSVPVRLEPVQFQPRRTRLDVVGTSRAVRSVDIYPEAAGEVESLNFTPGETVSAGQLLVQLEQRDEQLAVELARVTLKDATRLLERYQGAQDSGAVLPTTFDAAQTAVTAAEIALERAEVALRRRVIRAPFSGVVSLTDVEPGDRVNPDTLVTTLDDRSTLLVRFDVPEQLVGQLATGDPVKVRTFTGASELTARVVELGSRVNEVTRSLSVQARLDNSADLLRPGMSFTVAVESAEGRYARIPEVALRWGAEGAYVWRDSEGLAERVEAQVIQREEGWVLVDAPLRGTDQIIVEGVQRVREGSKLAGPGSGAPAS